MSLIRKPSLPFSAVASTAQARMRSKRSRLRFWAGTNRAIAWLPATVFGWFRLDFRPAIMPPEISLDLFNTRAYRFLQMRGILVLSKEISCWSIPFSSSPRWAVRPLTFRTMTARPLRLAAGGPDHAPASHIRSALVFRYRLRIDGGRLLCLLSLRDDVSRPYCTGARYRRDELHQRRDRAFSVHALFPGHDADCCHPRRPRHLRLGRARVDRNAGPPRHVRARPVHLHLY